jgi:hypothetical protein
MASQIEIRQRETGTLLGHFYAALEPDEVRQLLTAQGMRVFAEDLGISIPEMNDPHETPFHGRPDVLGGGHHPLRRRRLSDHPGARIGRPHPSSARGCRGNGLPRAQP